jgi:hypothetical protein
MGPHARMTLLENPETTGEEDPSRWCTNEVSSSPQKRARGNLMAMSGKGQEQMSVVADPYRARYGLGSYLIRV